MAVRVPFRRAAAWLPFLVLAGGCAPDETASPTAKKLRSLAQVYLDCAVARKGQGPPDEAAFKKHVRGMYEDVLKDYGIDPKNLDPAFTSDRDKEPFVVVYGQGVGSISGKSKQVIAHEKTGVGGKKLVAFVSGKVELADDARLQDLLAGK